MIFEVKPEPGAGWYASGDICPKCKRTEVTARIDSGGITQPRLLAVEQTATYLGRSEDFVRRFLASGKVPVVHLDSRPQFDIRDLEKQIAANKE